MTRKDYCKFALMLLRADYLSTDQKAKTATAMATVFASDNPRFDKAKFLQACGV